MTMLAAGLLAGCSADSTDDTTSPATHDADIRFNVDVWRVMEGTRATTFDNAAALQTEGSFTCFAYDAGTTTVNTTSNVSGITATWNGSTAWEFADKHYWPLTGSLDFFAYMPADLTADEANYISIEEYAAGNPSFSCTVPMTSAGQASIKEFIYALTTGQDKAHNAAGVNLTFKHPFTRIKLQLSSTQANIHINTITLKSLKNNGTCSFNGTTSTWTPSGDATNFVATLNADYSANDDIGTYIMIPQTFSGAIEVKATWSDWGVDLEHTVSTTLPSVTWAAGTSYTYTFTITATDLIVDTEKFTEQW